MALVQPPRLICSSTRLPSPEGFNVTVLLSHTWRGKVNIWRIIFAPRRHSAASAGVCLLVCGQKQETDVSGCW